MPASIALASASATRVATFPVYLSVTSRSVCGWHVDVQRRGIAVEGGYMDAACQVRSLDAASTILDGGLAARPLTIDTSFAPAQTATGIIVRGLTIENGAGDRVGGLKISD